MTRQLISYAKHRGHPQDASAVTVVGHYAQSYCYLGSGTMEWTVGRWWAGRVAAYWLL